MRIRKFKKDDAGKVSYLIRKTQRKLFPKHYSKKAVDYFCRIRTPAGVIKASKNRELFVAVDGDRILGIHGLRGSQVRTVFVNPKYHMKGVGRALMEYIFNLARKRKLKKLMVHSSPYAVGYYQKMGFKKIKKITGHFKDIKWSEILMQKNL